MADPNGRVDPWSKMGGLQPAWYHSQGCHVHRWPFDSAGHTNHFRCSRCDTANHDFRVRCMAGTDGASYPICHTLHPCSEHHCGGALEEANTDFSVTTTCSGRDQFLDGRAGGWVSRTSRDHSPGVTRTGLSIFERRTSFSGVRYSIRSRQSARVDPARTSGRRRKMLGIARIVWDSRAVRTPKHETLRLGPPKRRSRSAASPVRV